MHEHYRFELLSSVWLDMHEWLTDMAITVHRTVHLRFFMYTGIVFVFLLSIFVALGLHRNFVLFHFVCTCFRFLHFTPFHLWCTLIAFHSCYRISLKRFFLIGFCAMQSMWMCVYENESMTNFVNNSTSALLCNLNHMPKIIMNAY